MKVVDAIRDTPIREPQGEARPDQDRQDHEGDDRQRVIQALVRASAAFVGAGTPPAPSANASRRGSRG